ncbi:hypothetical protein CTAYLR_008954 [Chrysophaeum taylorii]|uniref:AMP-dependent synthetase/ligase domain-containing protein n=1 Tax=Chrysophaeum taylorii TaxID=2483200 RepID=A0AAD7UP17_9STRA|nr:hypothetical protein CTAYLR_008954 [Chrysophaeum taylorii]
MGSELSIDAACGEHADGGVESVGVWNVGGSEIPKVSPALRCGMNNSGDGFQRDLGPPALEDPEGNGTVWAMVAASVRTQGSGPCMGWRPVLKREYEGKFEKLTLGDFEWWSYERVGEEVAALASGLPASKGECLLIYAETQRDWMVTALACCRMGITVVTAYATLGEEGVTTALSQTGASVCVCDAKLLKVLTGAKKLPRTLKSVVTIGDAEAEGGFSSGREIFSLEKIKERGATKEATSVAPSEVALIMYTSGTTGVPKGVVVAHRSLVAMAISTKTYLPFFNSSDVVCAYLPLAHIMEFGVELWFLHLGGSMGYGSAHTLTDTGVKLQKGCRGDAPLLRPTALLFAPAVLDKVYAAVLRKVESSPQKKYLFDLALDAGKARFEQGLVGAGFFWDAILMKKIRALVGGRLRYAASGSAPLSPAVHVFVQTCFNCPVRQGYGCTETCGTSCLGVTEDNATGQVGPPTPVSYVRLRDWEEGGYLNADLENPAIGRRRGEVLIGGPSICDGYFVDKKKPDPEIVKKNEEDFATIDGVRYFCTGDVGEIDERGRLRIIDRKKDLFKGATGEYVALTKVEAALRLSKYVEIPVVYGRTGEKGVVALVCPQMPAIEDLKLTVGLGDLPYGPDLLQRPEILQPVSDALKIQCKQSGLLPFETPLAFALVVADDGSPALTPDNGFLTTTMKVKRPVVAKAFKPQLDAAYASCAN